MDKALEKYLSKLDRSFDVESLMSDELKKFDSISPPPSLFKYIPFGRSDFFRKPMLRFTQRSGLNDPFELMKRWNEFASEPFRDQLIALLKKGIGGLEQDKGALLEMLKEQAAKQGLFLGPADIAQASAMLLTPDGQRQFGRVIDQMVSDVDAQVDLVLRGMTLASEQGFSEMTAKMGVLSLTDNPINRIMWSVYASAGQGYLIEFNTEHAFFRAPNGRHLVWQVTYRDEIKGSFIENPMALFLTKHTDYAFEREWRMLKHLADSDEKIGHLGNEMHMFRVVPGMIKSITFGYNYDQRALAHDGAWITTNFDSDIKLRWISVNRKSGKFEIRDLA